jgi:hypothetical protein
MSVKRLIKFEDSMFKNRVFLNVLIDSLFFLQKKNVFFENFINFTNDLVNVEATKVLQYLGQILGIFLVCNLGDLICPKVFLPL